MWASRRRSIIVLIVLSFFLVTVVLPYWWTHREIPTCSDGKMNQNEQGIDCGGACRLVCLGGASNLSILWTKVFPVRDGVYDVVAYVENRNFTLVAPEVPYTARLYGEDGTVIAEKQGKTYAKPNELFAIFEGGMVTGGKIAVRGEVSISSDFRWYTATQSEQLFTVVDKRLTDPERKPKLSAVLTNDSPNRYRNIDATAIIYDNKHTPIGVSATRVEKIDANSSEQLFFTWNHPFQFDAETEECELPVDVVLALDRSGSMASESKDPAQPFTRVRDATASFVDFLTSKDQVGMVSFSTTASNPIDVPLMSDLMRARKRIESTSMGLDGVQYTNTADALIRAGNELETQRAREDARKIIVLLTDGEAMEPNRPLRDGDPEYAKRLAMETAEALRKAEISLYTIGLGVNANDAFLKAIATTPEQYYASPSVSDLRNVYRQIAGAICKKGPTAIEIIPRVYDVE